MNQHECRPLFFRSLQAARDTEPSIEVHDSIDTQLRDLVKTRNPSRKLTAAQIDEFVTAHLGDCPPSKYGVWVYYPWSRRLVHLLNEDEFIELRTNRNYYKITPADQAALSRKRIGVVGLSVGQSVALTMALERSFGQLRLADFDTIDLSNLNRLRTGVHNLGVPKVYVTAREIAEIDPFLDVQCFPEGLHGDSYDAFLLGDGKLDLLIEECDSIDVKIKVRQQAKRHGIPVLMDTSDRGMLDIERFDREPSRPIFHGCIGDPDPAQLSGLTTEQKVPYVLKIIGEDTLSTALRASMIEVESSISTWPQLASSVALGGGLTADVARRILLGQCQESGRFFVDLDELIPAEPKPRTLTPYEPPPPRLSPSQMTVEASRIDATPSDIPLDQVRRIVEDAILAPSGGNCQPWIWHWDGRLHLFHDRSRSHSLLDFEYAGGFAALGAACENVSLSAQHLGWQAREHVVLADDLAVTFTFEPSAATGFQGSYEWIAARNTNRRLQGRRELPTGALDEMTRTAASAGASLNWLTTAVELDEAGEILGAGDRLRFLDHELHRHLMSEVRFSAEEAARTGDGISVGTLELSPGDLAGIQISRSWDALALVKSVNGGANLTKMSRRAIRSSSAVGLLWMPSASSKAYLEGGRAVQRTWLAATRLGIAFHPMTALPYLLARLVRGEGRGFDPFLTEELSRLRPRYHSLFPIPDSAAQVMLFRLAVADAPSERAHRRSINECFYVGL